MHLIFLHCLKLTYAVALDNEMKLIQVIFLGNTLQFILRFGYYI